MSDEEDRLVTQIRAVLDEGAADLDAGTRSRLARARAAAIAPRAPAVSDRAQPVANARWWLPAGGAMAATVALAAVLWVDDASLSPATGVSDPLDFELITSVESLELFRDLDFYYWLEEEAPHAG